MALPLPQQQSLFAQSHTAPSTRDDLLDRYLRLREISKMVHAETIRRISADALMTTARRLGLSDGKALFLNHADEINFVYDMAIYTAPAGRSRAIDRFAASARFAPQSDEGLMVDAMCRSQFAILLIERRHDTVGVIATDILRRTETWLVDTGIESSMDDDTLIATRLLTPGPFSMTAGTPVPFEIEMLEPVCDLLPQKLAEGELSRTTDHRLFAEAVYRVALAGGVTDHIDYLDTGAQQEG